MITAQKSKNFGRLTINGEEYDVYLAKTEEQKKRGLQGVLDMDSDEGMLFFINESEPEETVFHTHNCHFPIDMLFLDDNFKILDIKTEQPETDNIKGFASYVLELKGNSGISKDADIDLDDEDSEYVMKMLAPDGSTQFQLKGGERIYSRKSTKQFIRKAIKAEKSKEDKDYKALGRAIFKELHAQDNRKPEYVQGPDKKED